MLPWILLNHLCKPNKAYKEKPQPCWQVLLQASLDGRNKTMSWQECKADPLILTIHRLPRCLKCMCQSTARKTYILFISNFGVRLFDTCLQSEVWLTSDCNMWKRTIMASVSQHLGKGFFNILLVGGVSTSFLRLTWEYLTKSLKVNAYWLTNSTSKNLFQRNNLTTA